MGAVKTVNSGIEAIVADGEPKTPDRTYDTIDAIAEAETSPNIHYKDDWLTVFSDTNHIRVNGKDVLLTPREYGLLKVLTSEAGRVWSNEELELLRSVWGNENHTRGQVRVYIHLLREMIEEKPKNPRIICNVNRSGYYYQPQGDYHQPNGNPLKPLYKDDRLEIYPYMAVIGGKKIRLSPREYSLLATMASDPLWVWSAEELREVLSNNLTTEGNVRVYISHLRRKLEADPRNPQIIITPSTDTKGYFFNPQGKVILNQYEVQANGVKG